MADGNVFYEESQDPETMKKWEESRNRSTKDQVQRGVELAAGLAASPTVGAFAFDRAVDFALSGLMTPDVEVNELIDRMRGRQGLSEADAPQRTRHQSGSAARRELIGQLSNEERDARATAAMLQGDGSGSKVEDPEALWRRSQEKMRDVDSRILRENVDVYDSGQGRTQLARKPGQTLVPATADDTMAGWMDPEKTVQTTSGPLLNETLPDRTLSDRTLLDKTLSGADLDQTIGSPQPGGRGAVKSIPRDELRPLSVDVPTRPDIGLDEVALQDMGRVAPEDQLTKIKADPGDVTRDYIEPRRKSQVEFPKVEKAEAKKAWQEAMDMGGDALRGMVEEARVKQGASAQKFADETAELIKYVSTMKKVAPATIAGGLAVKAAAAGPFALATLGLLGPAMFIDRYSRDTTLEGALENMSFRILQKPLDGTHISDEAASTLAKDPELLARLEEKGVLGPSAVQKVMRSSAISDEDLINAPDGASAAEIAEVSRRRRGGPSVAPAQVETVDDSSQKVKKTITYAGAGGFFYRENDDGSITIADAPEQHANLRGYTVKPGEKNSAGVDVYKSIKSELDSIKAKRGE